jgi:type IV pilus assembly protein PilY1
MSKASSSASLTPRLRLLAPTALALALLSAQAEAVVDLPSAPLQSAAAIPSNILFLLDDSGSMQFEMMPDSLTIFPTYDFGWTWGYRYGVYLFPPPNQVYGGDIYPPVIPTFDDANYHNFFKRSATNNTLFYDPTLTYTPWAKYDGSSYGNVSVTAAPFNPSNTSIGKLNLTAQQFNVTSAPWISGNSDTNYAVCGTSACTSYWPITFYVYKGSGALTSSASYMKYQIQGSTGYKKDLNGGTQTAVSSFTWGSTTRTVAEETQNFANWFSYYRSRTLAARAGASLAFARLGTNYRVGFATINSTTFGNAIPTSGSFENNNRLNWFNALLGSTVPPQGTPLKAALTLAGEYFSRTDDNGPYGPSPQLSCRRNFTILTTDGYYDAATVSGIGNEDNTSGSTITGPSSQSYQYAPARPYSDSYTNTLADISMYYWKKDLRTNLSNNLRPTSTNPSFWQNMNTFTLSLGVKGTLNPATDLGRLTSGAISWPDPAVGSPEKLDDLWHAAVNGHGNFVAAKDPAEFADGLVSALTSIGEAGGAWNIAVSSNMLEVDGKTFVARYDGSWGGDLWAVGFNAAGQMNTTSDGTPIPVWKASQKLPAAASRNIYTWKDSGGGGTTFTYNNLSSAKKTAIGSSAVVDYLRGVTSGELANGGTFRNRTSLLGDIANPAPAYVKASNTVFAAANDGMLHAFNANTGVELFAYIPGNVSFANLNALSSPTYSHKFINDGEIVVSDLASTGKNILVGSLGRGGKALYALDVTTPSSFDATKVLWEFTSADLGNTLGKPIIAKMNTGEWAVIVGNGYNSNNENAFLFVINLNTGALIQKIATGVGLSSSPNGLSSPVGFDQNGDGKADFVYAGDLLGNFWRFTVTGSASSWSAASLFVATDASGNIQPITGGLSVAIDPKTNKRWVFGGSGRYLSNSDVASSAIQSWYGLIDDGTAITSRTSLATRTINSESTQGSYQTRTFSTAVANDMVGKRGWYADLAVSGVKTGERMVSRSQYSTGVLYASSIIPSTDVCASGGSGYINAVSAFTGGSLVTPFFDINNDGLFNDSDKKSEGGKLVSTGSVRTGGMVGEITIKKLDDTKVTILACDTTGACKEQPNVNLGSLKGRVSWREIRIE